MTLIAKNLHCTRNNHALFQSISFAVQPSEMLQVMGENGAGKSSLLRICAGLLQPESGEIFCNVSDIFYLGHTLAIKSELTIKENLNNKYDKTVLKNWSLEHLENHFCANLSRGQQQRVALARLEMSSKKIWILDEPYSHLDTQGIFTLEKLLDLHLKNNGMILMATHRKHHSCQHFLTL